MFMAPKDVYGVNLMRMFVDELGGQKAVAKHFGINERSVRRWFETGKVPRAYVLALYWESKYGRSNIHTSLVNEIRMIYRQLCIVQEQYTKAKDMVAGMRRLHAGSSNEPLFDELPQLNFAKGTSVDGSEIPMHVAAEMHVQQPASMRSRTASQAFDQMRTNRRLRVGSK